jgi:hypothetical protein
MTSLVDTQAEFAAALFSAHAPVPPSIKGSALRRADRRFAVYRNNVTVGLVEALAARFPVVKRLVGDEFFAALARNYVRHEPPLSPLLIHYGATFANFVQHFEPAKPLPYLADVARLEYARGRAYHCADVDPLPREVFSALSGDRVGAARLTLHPSVSVIGSAFPLFSIWQVNQARAVSPVEDWRAEAVLVARPLVEVKTLRLNAGIAAFLTALQSGRTIAEAAEAGSAGAPEFDAAEGLAELIGQNLAVALLD